LCWREFLVLTAASLWISTMGARASGAATVVAVYGCVDNAGIVAPLTRFAVGDTSLATLEQCARSSAGNIEERSMKWEPQLQRERILKWRR
jgi:hypothetical protein